MYQGTRFTVQTWVSWPVLTVVAFVLLLSAAPTEAQHRDGDGDITMAIVGDLIITRALSVYEEPRFLKLRDAIRGATVGLGNMEMKLFEYGPNIIPAAESGGTYMRGDPDLAHDLAWMGFDMLSTANNHTMDWGVGGMRATQRALNEAGIRYAGSGENLALARAPAYLETPDGRVALISVSSSFADHMRAGHQRPDVRGRPGLAPMRIETTYIVPEEVYETIEQVRSQVGDFMQPRREGVQDTFRLGDEYRVTTTPQQGDLEALLATVRDATRQANWVVVSSHTNHEDPNPEVEDLPAGNRHIPAQALVTFARAAIDAGADAFYSHGPHVLRGIEIYQGKPIFYSLGDFMFQNETPLFQPYDNYEEYGLGFEALPSDFYDARMAARGGGRPAEAFWWDEAMAITEFRDGDLYQIRIIPVVLGYGLPRPQRGRPVAAVGVDAQRILELLQRLSEPFGTRIEIMGDEGVIRMPAGATDGQP